MIESLIADGFLQDRIERVGHLKLGFGIRAHKIADEATGEVFVKRIELKGRLRGQMVRLTTNEWYKAQQLAETCWPYVAWDPWATCLGLCAFIIPLPGSPRQEGDHGGKVL